MIKLKNIFLIGIVIMTSMATFGQSKEISVEHFEKVIVSQHIQVNFVEGNDESVLIESISVSEDKLNVEVSGNTLRIYLDGAKTITKSEKSNEYDGRKSIYDGTIVKATVTYKSLQALSLRGEEKFLLKSPLKLDKFTLDVYGESFVHMSEVDLDAMNTTIYGESQLEIKSGRIDKQKITAYGESVVKTMDVDSKSVKVVAYGEADIQINASEALKVTSYGEANISYRGDASLNKGIVIGDATIKKLN